MLVFFTGKNIFIHGLVTSVHVERHLRVKPFFCARIEYLAQITTWQTLHVAMSKYYSVIYLFFFPRYIYNSMNLSAGTRCLSSSCRTATSCRCCRVRPLPSFSSRRHQHRQTSTGRPCSLTLQGNLSSYTILYFLFLVFIIIWNDEIVDRYPA